MEIPERWSLTLIQSRVEYDSTVTLSFSPDAPLPFAAGQWIHLACAAEPEGRHMVRHMSIASAPNDPYLEFTMDFQSNSDYKRAMAALKPGDRVAAFKLRGEFTVPEQPNGPLVFLAGGLGVTPIRSLIRSFGSGVPRVPLYFIHVSRGAFLYQDEIQKLPIEQGRINRSGVAKLLPAVAQKAGNQACWYVSGSDRFVEGLKPVLHGLGVAEERIITENFH